MIGKLRSFILRAMETILILLVMALTLSVLWGVFTRFCLGRQASYTDELARILLVWVSMIGGALAFGLKAHLGVDYFVGKMDPEARKLLSIVVQLVTLALTTVVFLVGGTLLASVQMSQQLPTMPWLSRGVVYAAVPTAGVFIFMFTLENLIDIVRTPAEKLGAQTQAEG